MAMSARKALELALAIIEREQPDDHARISQQLRGLAIGCTIGDETFLVLGGDRPTVIDGAGQHVNVEAAAQRDAILELIDGERTILEMVMARRLSITADITLMVSLSRAERAFAEGAVRARSMRPLLELWRKA
jgi:ribosomal protein S12 methylthiotransferase accessory factor YcaO